MKKTISVFLVVLMLVSVFVPCVTAAESAKEHGGFGSMIYVSGHGEKCFIRNEYYSIYTDELFEIYYECHVKNYAGWCKMSELYDEYKMFTDANGNKKAKMEYIENIINGDGAWFITVVFGYDGDVSAELNKKYADSLTDDIEVLYVGTTTPCVVVGIDSGAESITEIIENENVVFVSPSFQVAFDINFTDDLYTVEFSPDAGDARKLLRYSAKIDTLPDNMQEAKEFLITGDSDFDGKITSADARTALRIAAGLESGRKYGGGTGSVWGSW